jgi:hypothetical protein
MNYQTSPVAILLQNRADFYKFALVRFPDRKLREHLIMANFSQVFDLHSFQYELDVSDLAAAMALEDPLKKPGLGEKWGRTVVSYSEFFDRAKTLEQLVLLACDSSQTAKRTTIGQLSLETEDRLRRLAELEDSLRYHRLRLFNS